VPHERLLVGRECAQIGRDERRPTLIELLKDELAMFDIGGREIPARSTRCVGDDLLVSVLERRGERRTLDPFG
jgi:hypothetical protein